MAARSSLRRVAVTPKQRPALQAPIAALDRAVTWPLAAEAVRLDRGPDAFAGLDRLGMPKVVAMLDGERLAAIGAGVLRGLPLRQGEAPAPCWQLTDVRVDPAYAGQHLPLAMLQAPDVALAYARAPRAFTVAMGPLDPNPDRLLRRLNHMPLAKFEPGPELGIYTLDGETVLDLIPLLEQFRGHVGYYAPLGVRDLVPVGGEAPVPIVHVTWDPLGKGVAPSNRAAPVPGHAHMFCAPHGDPLAIALAARGILPSSTAAIAHHRMGRADWRFLLTADC